MAYGDYITCCKCGVKLIYDGDRSQRNWWVERFGKEPEIECPNCKKEWVGLTDEEIWEAERITTIGHQRHKYSIRGQQITPADNPQWHHARAIEAKLKEKNT